MLKRLFRKRHTEAAPPAQLRSDIGYPPQAEGIAAASPADIRAYQKELEDRIRVALGLGQDFDDLVEPTLERLAALVHLLPASRSHHHCGVGGMYRHCLEVGLFALIHTERMVMVSYSDGTPQDRRSREIRSRVAACLAGLFHDLGKLSTDMRVVDNDGAEWRPILMPLSSWLQAGKRDRYYVEFRPHRHGNHVPAGVDVAQHVWTDPLRNWLCEPGPQILSDVNSIVAGQYQGLQIGEAVKAGDARSVQRDLKNQPANQAADFGASARSKIVDAMRRLTDDGRWKVNEAGGRVFVHTEQGKTFCYIPWPKAADEISRLLKKDRVSGIPKAPLSLAEILIESNQAVPFNVGEFEQTYWPIRASVVPNHVLHCLKIPADILYPDLPPSSIKVEVADEDPDDSAESPNQEHQPVTSKSSDSRQEDSTEVDESFNAPSDNTITQPSPEQTSDCSQEGRPANEQQGAESASLVGTECAQTTSAEQAIETNEKLDTPSSDKLDSKEQASAALGPEADERQPSPVEPKPSGSSKPEEPAIDLHQLLAPEIASWLGKVMHDRTLYEIAQRRVFIRWPEAVQRFDLESGLILKTLIGDKLIEVKRSHPVQKRDGVSVIALKGKSVRAFEAFDPDLAKPPAGIAPATGGAHVSPTDDKPVSGSPVEPKEEEESATSQATDQAPVERPDSSASDTTGEAPETRRSQIGASSERAAPAPAPVEQRVGAKTDQPTRQRKKRPRSKPSESEDVLAAINDIFPPDRATTLKVERVKQILREHHPTVSMIRLRLAVNDRDGFSISDGQIRRAV